jgi:hypothetical protein
MATRIRLGPRGWIRGGRRGYPTGFLASVRSGRREWDEWDGKIGNLCETVGAIARDRIASRTERGRGA